MGVCLCEGLSCAVCCSGCVVSVSVCVGVEVVCLCVCVCAQFYQPSEFSGLVARGAQTANSGTARGGVARGARQVCGEPRCSGAVCPIRLALCVCGGCGCGGVVQTFAAVVLGRPLKTRVVVTAKW